MRKFKSFEHKRLDSGVVTSLSFTEFEEEEVFTIGGTEGPSVLSDLPIQLGWLTTDGTPGCLLRSAEDAVLPSSWETAMKADLNSLSVKDSRKASSVATVMTKALRTFFDLVKVSIAPENYPIRFEG